MLLEELTEIAINGIPNVQDNYREILSFLIEFGFLEIKFGKIFTTEAGLELLKLPTE